MENFQLLGCRVQSITRSPDGIDGLLREFIVMMLAHLLKPGDGTEQIPRLQKTSVSLAVCAMYIAYFVEHGPSLHLIERPIAIP
jgi:hypothetical protein